MQANLRDRAEEMCTSTDRDEISRVRKRLASWVRLQSEAVRTLGPCAGTRAMMSLNHGLEHPELQCEFVGLDGSSYLVAIAINGADFDGEVDAKAPDAVAAFKALAALLEELSIAAVLV